MILSRSQKLELGKRLAFAGPPQTAVRDTVECVYHGVPLRFHLPNASLAANLRDFVPSAWRSSVASDMLDVFWLDPKDYTNSAWDEDAESDCDIERFNGRETAVQRDFVGIRLSDRDAIIVTKPAIDDGFFNSMRWLLPRAMVSRNSLLLHSSCVVNERGEAYFFLGPSGAGKTTIASLARPPYLVLGDDMNVVKSGFSGAVAEPGALGQRIS
ncbi:MAG: phosphoenolpyruvate carboxykinase (ATP), partial [Bdellovibrionia bacterium]